MTNYGNLLSAALLVALIARAATAEPLECDPAKVLGSETCTRCHQQEVRQWRATPHYETFETLHRKPEAKAIADRLGLRSVKRNDTCIKCHYTEQEVGGRVRIVEGVSCESCHGAAKDWVELHADYGGFTRETEPAAHRQQRRAASIAAGMNNPTNLYLIARQCLACHTTPEERLVNVGGHAAGTPEFELVAFSQGIVRHNYARTGGVKNAPSSLPRVRVMYVVGAMADLEASLRAAARATTADTFGKTAAARAARVKQRLWEVQRSIEHPLLGEALGAVAEVELRLGNADAIGAAADAVGDAAMRFAEQADGRDMAAIDRMLPPPKSYKY